MKKIFTLLYFIAISISMMGQAGQLDQGFGNGGVISTLAGGNGQPIFHMGKQALVYDDGEISFVTQFGAQAMIAKRLANGEVDTLYGKKGFSMTVPMNVFSAVLQSSEKIVVAGTGYIDNNFALVRFNTDGTLDNSFGDRGLLFPKIANGKGFAIDIKKTIDDKIIAAGSIVVNGVSQFGLTRLDLNGQVDYSFGINGTATINFDNQNAYVSQIILGSNGNIIVVGAVNTNSGYRFAVASFTKDGASDLSFNNSGKLVIDFGIWESATAVAVDNKDRIYIGGSSGTSTGYHFKIVRVTNSGNLDLSYNSTGYVIADFANSQDVLTHLATQNDGSIIASGTFDDYSGNRDGQLIHIDEDGLIDKNFGINGQLRLDIDHQNDDNSFLTILTNGDILTGGYTASNTYFAPAISCFKLRQNGTPEDGFGTSGNITTFKPGDDLVYGQVYIQSDGKIKILSSLSAVAKGSVSINRFNPNGTIDDTYEDNGSKILDSIPQLFNSSFQPDGKLLRIIITETGNLVLNRFNEDGSPDISFGIGGKAISNLGINHYPSLIRFQADGKILVGGFVRDDSGSDFFIVRYNKDGSVDFGFGANGYVRRNVDNEENVQALVVAPDGKILFGGSGYRFPPDFSYFYFDVLIGRLNSDGSFDQSFGVDGIKIVNNGDTRFLSSLAVQNDGKILLSSFFQSDIYSYYNTSLERFNLDGTRDESFALGNAIEFSNSVLMIGIQANDNILLHGIKINQRGIYEHFITRFNRDGILDYFFGENGIIEGTFTEGDNNLSSLTFTNNSFFIAGNAKDEWGNNLGLIAKFQLESPLTTSCPGNQIVSIDKGKCSAVVNNIDPSPACNGNNISYKLTGATVGSGKCSVSGLAFNKGITTVTYTLDADTTKNCSFTVTVQDNEAPVITNLTTNIKELWPADRKLKDVKVNYTATDNCGIVSIKLSVTSNESLAPADYQIIDDHHIRLRADRSNSGNGRIYTITATITDAGGLSSKAATTVTVPKNKKQPKLTVQVANNPTNKEFTIAISSDTRDMINATVFNGNGVVIKQLNNLSAPFTLKIGSNYLPGAYYIRVTQADVSHSTKLIKQ